MAEKNTPKRMGKKNAPVMPSKKTMNFVHHVSSFNPRKVIPVILLVVVIAAVLTKVGILDLLDEKTRAYNQLAAKQDQLTVINAKLTGYDELAAQYGRYSYGWMNQTEIDMVSRMDVLNLVEERIIPSAYVENIAVNNNVLTMNIHGITLEQASAMVVGLEESPLVEKATVYNAVASDAEEAKIFLSINLQKPAEKEAE